MITFNVKKVWFDKIKSGEKTHEYREFKPYWTTVFKNEFGALEFSVTELRYGNIKTFNKQHLICFMNGMVPENKKTRLYANFKSIKLMYGMETDLKINKPVYDIEFELINQEKRK
jgi:hypothetical protein